MRQRRGAEEPEEAEEDTRLLKNIKRTTRRMRNSDNLRFRALYEPPSPVVVLIALAMFGVVWWVVGQELD